MRRDGAGADCAPIADATQASHVLTGDDVGARLRVGVTATNARGRATKDSVLSAAVTPARPPVNTVEPTISGVARDGQTLTAAPGTWTGFTGITYTYEWLRRDGAGAGCTLVSGPTTAKTYRLLPADVDHTVRARVHGSNADGAAFAESDPLPVLVAASPPVATTAPAVTGVARDGERLTATPGVWSGTPTLSYTYAWERCNAAGAACAPVAGAESATFDLTGLDVRLRLRAQVTATNAAGSVVKPSPATAIVDAAPPEITASPSLTGTARGRPAAHR